MNQSIITMIENGDSSLIATHGNQIYKSSGLGVKPIILPMREDLYFCKDYEVADTIIGRAATLLLILSGATAVYGKIMSRPAVEVFTLHEVEYQYGTLVDVIKNREGNGVCPLEDAVKTIHNPQIAFSIIEERIKELMNNKHMEELQYENFITE